ncbi:MAG: DNA gyrase subunit A [Proteobacteria bacterium]|nr:DNA gyrase subunit A [Pseudomonadota bacterium]
MSDFAKELLHVNIEEEMKQSYMDYAMSVIVGRALPDVRDGLKPVHRRVIYAMHEAGMDFNKPYKKSARIVGEVLGKYHPHGDTAVYDTIVRMAQNFSLRYMLVDGQGNFGSVDGDSPAAMRYTEVRMAKISHELLADIDKETVDFTPNYDESEHEPNVLPTKIPNLLINGSSGIAVGMATNIPPHNINEVVTGCLAYIDNPDITIPELIEIIPGPDFPTAAIINGSSGIHEAYHTGRGRIKIRARTEIEEMSSGRERIVVTELPYQVNKARLLERIAELVKEKKIEGISELRDESDKDGMRMVIEVKRGEQADVLINNLYKHTAMQNVFGINIVALVDGQPKIFNLKELIEQFIRHRREVVNRRTVFELKKARARAHILEGQAVALANIDPLIKLIKESANPAEAKVKLLDKSWEPGLVKELLSGGGEQSRPDGLEEQYGLFDDGYHLSPVQAQAILELRLHRLTGLEIDKIVDEYKEIIEQIKWFLTILGSQEVLMGVIREELEAILSQYGDERRTEIRESMDDLNYEDMIAEEERVVTLSYEGYVKTQPLSDYAAQRRGGRGKSATSMKEEDFIDKLFVASSHDMLLCFTNLGQVYWKKVYELPLASRGSRGRPIINILPLAEGEKVNALLPIKEFLDGQFILQATANGTAKKTPLLDYSRPRVNGIRAINLQEGDKLIDVQLTDGQQDIMLFSSEGKAVRFNESTVRSVGRVSTGVRGMRLPEGHHVHSLIVVPPECDDRYVLTATENGYGKRTKILEYPAKGRGGKGVLAIKNSERNGSAVGACLLDENSEIMLITDGGTIVRTRSTEISVVGRNTQGVRLIRLTKDEKLVQIARVCETETDDEELLEEESEKSSVGNESLDQEQPED